MGVEIEAVELHAAGDVDLADVLELELGEQGTRIEAMVARVRVDVVQVEHEPAAAFAAERVEKGRFVHLAVRDVEVVDVVLEQEGHGHAPPHFADARHEQLDRLAVARQGQGDADVHQPFALLGEMESEVVAVPGKAETPTPALDLVDMAEVEDAGTADRQADAMRDEWPAAARPLEPGAARRIVDVARLGTMTEIGPEGVGNDLDVVEFIPCRFDQRRERDLVRQAHAQPRQRLHRGTCLSECRERRCLR